MSSTEPAIATVRYPTVDGSATYVLREGESAAFGRGEACPIRFGHLPEPDRDLPRIAGRLSALNGRVFVESSGTVGHRALEVITRSKRTQVALGEGFSCNDASFEVLIPGPSRSWSLSISMATSTTEAAEDSAPDGSSETLHIGLSLSARQMIVLLAYYEPIRTGRADPATHREVATALSYHENTVRKVLYEVWEAMIDRGIPMLDVDDKRVAVVEAARIHGLLRIDD